MRRTTRAKARGKGPLVAVAVPFRLPDGRGVLDAAESVTAECRAVPAPDGVVGGVWRTVPITVEVRLDGHESLEYEWRVADGGLPTAALRLVVTDPAASR